MLNNNIADYLLANSYAAVTPLANLAKVGGFFTLTFSFAYVLLFIALVILMVATTWKLYVKAGQPGWASIIPIYNVVVMLKIIRRPLWWIILMFIPLVSIVMGLVVIYNFAKVFGKGIGYTLGLLFLPFIFYPILAFGSAQYQPPTVPVTQ